MSKKFMLLIVLAISVLSVIIIAVWGTLPESQNQSSLTALYFENYEINDEGDKIINLLGIVDDEEPYYTLTYQFLPNDAYTDITVSSSKNEVIALLDSIKQEILINFSTADSIGDNVTIRITDQKTNTYDEITLIFKVPDIIIGD
ncbi:MAG: hypothetical protein JEZ05_09145 [Tenericutes bacterium]|nr:hypothetical protein [Mycoplasmatota bacterium]